MKQEVMDAGKLAERLGMSPQEEGGMVKENHYPFAGPGRAESGQSYYYFKPNTPTTFHTLDCDEYWVYHAGANLEAWLIDPDGNLDIRQFGALDGAELCIYLKKGTAFAAKPVDPSSSGTLISAITVPRFSQQGFHLLDREQVTAMCPAAKAFFENGGCKENAVG